MIHHRRHHTSAAAATGAGWGKREVVVVADTTKRLLMMLLLLWLLLLSLLTYYYIRATVDTYDRHREETRHRERENRKIRLMISAYLQQEIKIWDVGSAPAASSVFSCARRQRPQGGLYVLDIRDNVCRLSCVIGKQGLTSDEWLDMRITRTWWYKIPSSYVDAAGLPVDATAATAGGGGLNTSTTVTTVNDTRRMIMMLLLLLPWSSRWWWWCWWCSYDITLLSPCWMA